MKIKCKNCEFFRENKHPQSVADGMCWFVQPFVPVYKKDTCKKAKLRSMK